MKSTKEQGITLIALIITIIVLVILAGVALNTLFGNNSVLDNSEYAKQEYNKSLEKEALALAFSNLKMKLYTDDTVTEITAELLEQQLNEAGNNVEVEEGENGTFVVTFKNTGDQYEVAANGRILGEDKTEVAVEPEEEEIVDADEIIYDVATLSAFRDKVNAGDDYTGKVVKVTADIDFGENNTTSWEPIGKKNYFFNGTFDGQGHDINNLYINGNNVFCALFAGLNIDGIIKNLKAYGSVTANSDRCARYSE